jgi:hypothetical protein
MHRSEQKQKQEQGQQKSGRHRISRGIIAEQGAPERRRIANIRFMEDRLSIGALHCGEPLDAAPT